MDANTDTKHTIVVQFSESEISPYLENGMTVEMVIATIAGMYESNKSEDVKWAIQWIEEESDDEAPDDDEGD